MDTTLTPEQVKIVQNYDQEQKTIYNRNRGAGFSPADAFGIVDDATKGRPGDKKPFFQRATETVTDVIGGKELAQGAGQAGAGNQVLAGADQVRESATKIQNSIIDKIKEARANGDTSKANYWAKILQSVDTGGDISKGYTDNLVTNNQVLGSTAKLAGTFIGGFAGESALAGGASLLRSAAIEGAIQGGSYGLGEGVSNGKSLGDISLDTIKGVITGSIGGAVLGKGLQVGGTLLNKSAALTEKAAVKASKLSDYFPKAPSLRDQTSEGIMNKIARLKPTDATKFEKQFGESHGKYLKDSGNFSTPQGIIENEATKFTTTLADKEAAISKLPGTYKDGSIVDALSALKERVLKSSSENIKPSYAKEVDDLLIKYKNGGLTMEEVNNLKKLYEKNVKLGYNKLRDASETIEKATNIDSALVKWQDGTATKLGLSNLKELNTQIRKSKFIIDALGDQIIGKTGLNGVTLTDFIVLSGGNPAAVLGFLTKKIFSSKAVQARIAEFLSTGGVKELPKSLLKTTPESINRTLNPEGFLSLPKGGSSTVENKVPVLLKGESVIEPRATQIYADQATNAIQAKNKIINIDSSLAQPLVNETKLANFIHDWTVGGHTISKDEINLLKSTKIGIDDLPVNKSGEVTLYKDGAIKEGQPQSYSLNKKEGQTKYLVPKEDVLINFNSKEIDALNKRALTQQQKDAGYLDQRKLNSHESEVIAISRKI